MHPTIHLFSFTLPSFGMMMAIGMLSAFALLLLVTRKWYDFSEDDLFSAALVGIICGMLGAKVLYWIVELDQILADPASFLTMLTEGWVFYGALIGGVGGLLVYCLIKKKPFLDYVDLFAPSLILAQGFGRIGCFLAGCCYGSPSSCSIAVTFPPGGAAPAGIPLLPTQLMESAFLFLLTIAMVLLLKKRKPSGTVTGWYLVSYGVWRFIIEFFRSDDRGTVGALSTSQFIGIFIVLAGVILLTLIRKGIIVSRETIRAAEKEAETEPEAETEAKTEPEAETEKKQEAETKPEAETEVDTEPEAKQEAETKTEAETEAETEPEAETEAEADPEKDKN